MEKIDLENRIKELELELSMLKSSQTELKNLQETDQRLRNLVELSIYPILILKGDNMILEIANDPILKIFKVGKEAVGKSLVDLFPEIKDQPYMDLLLDVYYNNISHYGTEQPVYFLRENGEKEIVYFNFAYHPYKENDGSVSGVLVYATDVTEHVLARKKAEESEHRYHNLVYNSPYMIAIFKGKDTIIEIANDAIIETWGKGRDIFGKSLFEILPEAAEQGFDKLIQNVYETGEPFHAYETPVTLLRNGKQQLMHYNFIYQAQRNLAGEIEGVAILANEVTPQALLKKALAEQREIEQKALKSIEESNQRYYSMLMESPFAFSIMKGNDMVVTLANSLMKEFWGKGNDVEGKTLLEILPEIKDQPFPEMIEKVYTTGIPVHANEILGKINHNGQLTHKYFNVVFQPYYEADNSISGVIQIAYDVTEMVLARKKIEDSDKRYNMMLMKSPFAFAILKGKDMVLAMANDTIKEMWGKGNEIEGKPLIEVLPELKGQGFTELLDKVYTTGNPYIANEALAKVKRNGKMEDVYFNFVYQPYRETDDTISGVTIIAIEVTNEVIAKQKIKDSQQQLQNIFMQAPFALNIYEGKELVISLANKHFCEIIGKTESEILGKKLFDAFPETVTQGLDKILSDIFSTGIPFKGNEFPVHFVKNGNEFKGYFDFIYQPIFDYNKNVSGVINVAIDVTDKVLARKKTEDSEQRFRLLVMQAPVAIGVVRGEKYVVEIANAKILEIWGRTEDQVLNKPIFEVLTELEGQGFEELVDNVYTTGERFVTSELPLTIMRSGQLENAYVTFVYEPLREVDGTISGIMVLAHEITDLVVGRKKMEVQNALFEDMLMTSPGFVCTFSGPEHVHELVNEQYQSLFGKRHLKGKPIMEALPELEGQGFDKLLDNVYTTGETYVGIEIPATMARDKGLAPELRYFNFSYQPMYNEFKEIYSILLFGHEVTEVVKAKLLIEKSEAHFRLMADLMPAKISNATPEGSATYFNKHWLDFSGYNFEDLRDFGYHQIMHPDEITEFQTRFQHAANTLTDLVMEMRFKNTAGDFIWHLNIASPIKDENGKLKMWVGSTTEIQHQKEQRDELEKAVEERTFELKEANASLKENNKTLQSMNKELEAFTYVSSHDLQEPLRKIQMMAGRILEAENQNLSETGKNHLIVLRKSADRMRTLIDDLLAFSRLNTADIKFEKLDLHTIIEEIKKEFEDILTEKNATIEMLGNSELYVVRFQFRQLMNNLIGNALKFSNPKIAPHIIINSKILQSDSISLPASFEGKQVCHITVSDNGIGFKKEFKTKIFEVFQRLHSKEEYSGTGIGLAIVKKIVDNHNGIITAKSELNNGATFDIYIPFN